MMSKAKAPFEGSVIVSDPGSVSRLFVSEVKIRSPRPRSPYEPSDFSSKRLELRCFPRGSRSAAGGVVIDLTLREVRGLHKELKDYMKGYYA